MVTALLFRGRFWTGGARMFSGKSSGTMATRLFLERFCPVTLSSKSLPTMAAVFSNCDR